MKKSPTFYYVLGSGFFFFFLLRHAQNYSDTFRIIHRCPLKDDRLVILMLLNVCKSAVPTMPLLPVIVRMRNALMRRRFKGLCYGNDGRRVKRIRKWLYEIDRAIWRHSWFWAHKKWNVTMQHSESCRGLRLLYIRECDDDDDRIVTLSSGYWACLTRLKSIVAEYVSRHRERPRKRGCLVTLWSTLSASSTETRFPQAVHAILSSLTIHHTHLCEYVNMNTQTHL